eukprot:SAG25_NODE_256_length_10933_cov_24.263522_12_plen_58_part_00
MAGWLSVDTARGLSALRYLVFGMILADGHSVTFSRFSGGIYENITLLQSIRVCYTHM